MAVVTLYYQGGVGSTPAPGNGRAQEEDNGANTFTTWGQDGSQTSQRSLTPAEQAILAAMDASTTQSQNVATLKQRASTALTNNIAYLAIPSPTQAQAVAQVAALTRQVDGLIKFLLNLFDDLNGT